MKSVTIFGVEHIPEISPGDDIANQIIHGLNKQKHSLEHGDIVVVTSKIVSKAEGCILEAKELEPSPFAVKLAETSRKDPKEVEAVLRESVRPVKISEHVMIMETKHGFICANAGVDQSNLGNEGSFLLLPPEPDVSASKIRSQLQDYYGVEIAVIISDTFGRPWRMGQTNIAIGVSGILPIIDYKGKHDQKGRVLQATEIAIADQIAGSAELVMGKIDGIPVAVVRGYDYPKGNGSAKQLIRPKHMDLFR